MPRFLLWLPLSLVFGGGAAWLARTAGGRWLWPAAAALVVSVALLGAARVGTGNPLSRTARWDPILFFVMTAVLLAAPAVATALAAASTASGGALRGTLWSAVAFLAALPVGFVAAVAVEVLWPH